MSILDAALDYVHKGYYIAPLCYPDTEGNCACGRDHQGKDVGKAPLTPHGINDSTICDRLST